ncbi:TCP-1/cpn60 chaperonin family protein [Proteus mirabilis]|uniref:TCP-1/cpn60 chaperonin family protein n=1 Tax=Proteus mirabilis TaxID=584 RepID=UPI0034D6E082
MSSDQPNDNKNILKNNVVPKDTLNESISYVLTTLHDTLLNSYGPPGGNTILDRQGDTPLVTKDGLQILQNIRFYDLIHQNLNLLIRNISTSLVDRVGDGSSSAIVIAYHLYHKLKKVVDQGNYNSRDIRNIILSVQRKMESEIMNSDSLYRRFEDMDFDRALDSIKTVAALSNNNDSSFGEKIVEAFKVAGVASKGENVRFRLNPSDNSEDITFGVQNGFSYENAVIDSMFAFKDNSPSLTIDAAFIVPTYNLTMERYEELCKLHDAQYREKGIAPNVVILADTIPMEVSQQYATRCLFYKNQTHPNGIYLLKLHGLMTEAQNEDFNDLCVYTSSNPNLEQDPEASLSNYAGFAEQVVLSRSGGINIIKGAGWKKETEDFVNLTKDLQEEIDKTSTSLRRQRGRLRNRLQNLNGNIVTIFVGGRSTSEKESNLALVEDSVLACRSLMKSGVTMGSNITPFWSVVHLKDKKMLNSEEKPFADAIEEAYISASKVFWKNDENILKEEKDVVYNIVSERTESIDETSVLAPVKTDIEIMNASFSIVTLLLTSNQFV